jgi:hypothetical protein
MNAKTLKKSINLANKNFAKWSKFTVAEFQLIADHVMNSEFIERVWLHKQVSAITFEQMEAIVKNRLEMQMEMVSASSMLHTVMGGHEGTGIDSTSYVVAMWAPEQLERL